MSEQRHQITRVRREPRRRTIYLVRRAMLGPRMLRLDFESEELRDFESAAPDDHIKLFVPDGAGGVVGRDYTPRRFDNARGTLTIDFALHDAGLATCWAKAAQIGDTVEIGGPRGSAIVPDDFDWYLLVGDETALPAMSRRLEDLRANVAVTLLALIDGPADRLDLTSDARLTCVWVERQAHVAAQDAALLRTELDRLIMPPGDGYAWIGAEAEVARVIRHYLAEERGHPRQWIKAAGYWQAGTAGSHVTFTD